MADILLVEDNEAIQKVNHGLLTRRGYTARLAMNLAEARTALAEDPPDLIVLDIELPDGNGLDFLIELRTEKNPIPVLLLTARSEADDIVKGIQDGGDDYIAKPYDHKVFMARVENLLRKAQQMDELIKKAAASVPDVMKYGRLTVNNAAQRVTLDGEDVNLKPKEFQLLTYFLRNIDKKFTAEEIYEAVWGQDALSSVDTVKVRIRELRVKLKMDEAAAVVIETVERKFYVCRLTGSGSRDDVPQRARHANRR